MTTKRPLPFVPPRRSGTRSRAPDAAAHLVPLQRVVLVGGAGRAAALRHLAAADPAGRRACAPRGSRAVGAAGSGPRPPPAWRRCGPARPASARAGTFTPRISIERIIESEPFVRASGLPPLELHHEFDALRRAHRGDAEQLAHVHEAEPPQLHVVARELGTGADDHALGAPAHLHGIVGHEPVAAADQSRARIRSCRSRFRR